MAVILGNIFVSHKNKNKNSQLKNDAKLKSNICLTVLIQVDQKL